jgi:hypothetical protein
MPGKALAGKPTKIPATREGPFMKALLCHLWAERMESGEGGHETRASERQNSR